MFPAHHRSSERPRDRARPIKAGLLAATCLGIGLASSSKRGREVDAAAFHAINGAHSPTGDEVFGVVTELGAIAASAAAAAVLAFRGRPGPAARASAAAMVTWLAGQGLKKAFGRPRPWQAHPQTARVVIDGPTSTSWPSSHPAVVLAFLTVACRDLDPPPLARAGLTSVAGVVGFSRTYLGVHFPSDVIGGLLLGRAVGLAWPSR